MHGFDRNEAGKLFVGGLSWDTSKESLLQYFSQYGEVADCIVMKNQETGKSRGFGFVTYRDTACVEVVLSVPSHVIDGRQVDPKACNPKGQQRGGGGGERGGGPMGDGNRNRGPRGGGGPHGDKKVFMGGLPNSADEDAIRNFFSQYGKLLEVTVMYDNQKQRSRGFGFLTFETEEAVNAVCREHYINFNGKKVECKRATPRSNQGGGNDEPQHHIPVSVPHPGGMPPNMDMGMHGGPPPQQPPPGPEPQWGAPQEPQWSPPSQQSPQPPQVGGPPGQFPPGVQLPAQYQSDQAPGMPPGWPQQPPHAAGGWPPGSVPPPQQPGAAPGSAPFLAQQPVVTASFSSTPTFQSPPGAAIYQYAASPPGAPQQPPQANGQVPPSAAVGQPAPNSFAYTAPSYGSPPNVAAGQAPGAGRPGYQEFTGSHVQVASPIAGSAGTSVSSAAAYSSYPSPYGAPPAPVGSVPPPDPYAQTGIAPSGAGVQVTGPPVGGHPPGHPAGISAAAYGSTPLAQSQVEVVGNADPAAPKPVDYSSYYSQQYGYPVEGAPGASSAGASSGYGARPSPVPAQVQSPNPSQPPYGAPEGVPQAVAYGAGAPGPSPPSFQRQGSGQGYHPYARR